MSPAPNPMRDQIFATPAALKVAFAEIELAARLVLATPEIYRMRRMVLTGSGDSYFAAKATELALIVHTGLPVEVRAPLEAGRYHAMLSAPRDLENTLVIALSNSGGAARVVEAVGLYRARGASTLGITKNAAGRLAQAAAKTLLLPVPALPSAPGFGPYLFAVVALLLIGIRIGEVRMQITMDEAQALRQRLVQSFDTLAETIATTDSPARRVAERLTGEQLLEFVGGGPAYAVSAYGAAKMLEATGRHAYAQDLEEWTHLNYFDAAPDTIATVLTLPPDSRSAGRTGELLSYMRKLGRQLTIVGAPDLAPAERTLPVASDLPEIWSPLLLSAPHALLASHLAELSGAQYGRGSRGRWDDSADASTVQKSALWEPGK